MTDAPETLQVERAVCPSTVSEQVWVQARVIITPHVCVGHIQSFCVGGPIIGTCPETPVEECSFTVSQRICVQIPLVFSATAEATPTGIVCGTPSVGGCTS